MCLVSYIPTKFGFVLSSNRDESPLRKALTIEADEYESISVYYPKDIAGGSWFFASTDSRIICLLNGAFEKHERMSSYRISRGMMMKRFYNYSTAIDFFEEFEFHGLEPFTMIIREARSLYEFRWDGNRKHIKRLDITKEYIWSSSTLYGLKIQEERERVFRAALEGLESRTASSIEEIHLLEDRRNLENGFVMNRRNQVKTISFSQFVHNGSKKLILHLDLESGKRVSNII